MITLDPAKRAQISSEVMQILRKISTPDDADLILSFASVVLSESPDHILFRMPPGVLSHRLISHFQFIVHEMPPSTQLFKSPPGIHVSVYNPMEDEALSDRVGSGLPVESTVIRTHTPDAPFIFESIKNYLSKSGLRVLSTLHPIFAVRRQWERIVWIGPPHEEGVKESYCYFQIESVDSKERRRHIQREIFSILKSVILAVEDFQPMLLFTKEISGRINENFARKEEASSASAFIQWLVDENYVFIGTARYDASSGKPRRAQSNSSGVFKDPELLPVIFPGLMEEAESHILPEPADKRIVSLDFCKHASAIYHLEPIDYIVFREFNAEGSFVGASLLLGRFARSAVSQQADRIPILREKIRRILHDIDAVPQSHFYREITTAFNRFPIRELFYASPADLRSILEPIAFMNGDEEIVVRARNGSGYVAVAIAFSRLRYSYEIMENLRRAFSDSFGSPSFSNFADCGAANLLLFYFESDRLNHPIDESLVYQIVSSLVTTWEERAYAALLASFGEKEGRRLYQRYIRPETRSGLYREITAPEMVPEDIRCLESLEDRLEIRIEPHSSESATLHLYSFHSLALTETLKTLGNLGLEVTDEIRVPILLPDDRHGFIYRYEIAGPPEQIAALSAYADEFVDALRNLNEGRTADDALNGLILSADLRCRDVELLRTVRNHLLQIHTNYNADTLNGVLLKNYKAAKALFQSFAARFDPSGNQDRAARIRIAEEQVKTALESVSSLAEDAVLRAFHNLIQASLRTNFYQAPERPVFSIKVDCAKVDGMPTPKPMFEIYVHSNKLEGVHLRGGRVARGGIRWSDRPDDFRTEILGLMQTQMLKNTIIVPVGSKGGFILKGKLPPPPALDSYLIDRYSEYISGLLDITDNIVDNGIIHPPEVIRHDGDDPYLVVAADKGTAHLSDTANDISFQYGYWLSDAFASGGRAGFDHKKIGITARGAWECVKHHFRNLGTDIQKQPFTVCGIGDMSGDVFGNGMLQSKAIKLIAAFNHQHIFMDPDPDPEKSYSERERLFRLPRSNWRDYDSSAISAGGGVFERSAKSIKLSPQIQKILAVDKTSASGEELVRHILTASVDLLYNGGIGTYVKSEEESDSEVGDHANDSVRILGSHVRARVVGEGGNLGFTQKGRIVYWMNGGLINTDAIDNSAGVDTSDHEVNIKILLDLLVKKRVISGKEERNQILAEMTEQIAELVLADNINQSRALTLDGLRSAAHYQEFVDLLEELKHAGILDRLNPEMPSREELLRSSQKHRGLPRPLLADALGYIKMWAYERLIQSDLPDSASALNFLEAYFPKRLRAGYKQHYIEHPLKREIIATSAINYVINNGGVSLIPKLMRSGNPDVGDAIGAYLAADLKMNGNASRRRILESGLSAEAEHQALLELEDSLFTTCQK